ncbi:ubiquinone/menaquinone biosynthesis C-methylase UbiE [Hoeflea marina]|uniref:Ubiquinone/menaquinone biosynthesis C-methylase UbiE n=1 Tax=Hoeflea marina TaxID=274592 RepID=A0A317PGI3_9HYPH|nr:class I SAM-dependent methyltransferase [Hoeflea marina]PWV99056.1 ubiquinone/menaquinone biosynthesis C-methylase UbiE [Hoeflea marina]
MPRPDADQSAHNRVQLDYYEGRKHADNKRVFVGATPYVNNHLDKFLSFSNLDAQHRILDIGCGMGKYTIPLVEAGYQVDGLDLSPRLLEELKRQAASRARIATICGDILNPDPALLGSYDHVVGFFMLHHLFDLQQAFKQIARLLKPGGQVTFLEPNPWCALFYIQITLAPTMSWKAEKGILNLTPGKTARSLEAAGFADVKFQRFGILPPAIRNTTAGAAFERVYDRMPMFRPVSAFQLVSARLEAAPVQEM